MWGETGQKITWTPKVTPESQRQSGGWYDNPATGFNTRWWASGQGPQGVSSPTVQPSQSFQPVGGPVSTIPTPSGANIYDPVAAAQKLRDFTIQSNQPAIGTLQASIAPLQDRYAKLLDSIKQQGTVATNAQTLATANELGRRGILPNTGLGEQTMATSLLPVTSTYAGLGAQAGLAENQDIRNITNAIAALQTGNPSEAISGGLNLSQIGQQSQALENARLLLQNVQIPQAQAGVTSALAGAGLAGANTALANIQAKLYDPTYITGLLGKLGINLGASAGGISDLVPMGNTSNSSVGQWSISP